jgi:hypothetical protein
MEQQQNIIILKARLLDAQDEVASLRNVLQEIATVSGFKGDTVQDLVAHVAQSVKPESDEE